MTIEWDDSYSIGDHAINEQHKYLFRLANEFLLAKGKAQQSDCARQLFHYTEKHFSYEEALMRRLDFPWLDEHVKAHLKLKARLAKLNQNILNDAVDPQELENFVRYWALFHIPNEDVKLAEYLNYGQTREGDLGPE